MTTGPCTIGASSNAPRGARRRSGNDREYAKRMIVGLERRAEAQEPDFGKAMRQWISGVRRVQSRRRAAPTVRGHVTLESA